MTEEKEIIQDMKNFLERMEQQQKKAKKKKGIFSKSIVFLCILLVVGYTGICLLMQWRTGTQPEPQLTMAFFAFITVELWNLAKIKREGIRKEDSTQNNNSNPLQ